YAPGDIQHYGFQTNTPDLISGTATDGVYQTSFTIPQYAAQGTWTLNGMWAQDLAGNVHDYSVSDLQTAGFPTSFEQQGQGDTTGPDVVDFTFSPTTMDTSSGSQKVTVTIHATDDLAGVNNMGGTFYAPGDIQHYGFQTNTPDLISGTATDGVYQTSFTIPQYAAQGTWTLNGMWAHDLAGNVHDYSVSDLQTAGFPTSFEQQGQGDTTGPDVVDFTFSPTTMDTSSGSQKVTVTIHATDDLAGVNNMGGTFYAPGDIQHYGFQTNTPDLISGTATDGVYQTSFTIPQYAAQGTWTLNGMWAHDLAGNVHDYSVSDLQTAGFPTSFEQQGQGDTTGPDVVDFTFSPTTMDTSSGSQKVTVTIHATDDLAGVNNMGGTFYAPGDIQHYGFQTNTPDLISGTATDGVYQTSFTIPQYAAQGTWTLNGMWAQDLAGNVHDYSDS